MRTLKEKGLWPLIAVLGVALLGLASPPKVSAEVVTNVVVPVSGSAFSPCTGENVSFSGKAHVQFRVTVDGSGGFHVGLHENLAGVSGTSASGIKYQIPAASNETENFTNGATEGTITLHQRLVAQGGHNDLDVKILEHITIDANGNVRVVNISFEFECK